MHSFWDNKSSKMLIEEKLKAVPKGADAGVSALYLPASKRVFNTAMADRTGIPITDRRTIARNYLATWFWIDLVAIIVAQPSATRGCRI